MDQSDAFGLEKESVGIANFKGSFSTSTDLANHKRIYKKELSKDFYTTPGSLTEGHASISRKHCNDVIEAENGLGDEPVYRTTRNYIDEGPDQKEGPDQDEERLEKMRGAVKTLLECVGEDPDREGLLATPSRYAKALLFLTKGYKAKVEEIVNNALFHEGHNGIVVVKDIEIHSLCEHHLLPFTGKMHIGYIPSDTIIGISKLSRIAEMFSQRLQIQERLTKEVAHAINQTLKPQGVAIVMESRHLCMAMRGVEETCATTITTCVLGCFEKNSKTRNEFMSLISINRR